MRGLVILLSLLASSAFGQLTVADYLSSSLNEAELRTVQGQIDYANEVEFKSPILREVEMRIRETRFGEGIEDYKLRFSPINPFERAANKRYAELLDTQLDTEYRWRLNEILKSRYEVVVEYLLVSRLIELIEEEIEFYTGIQKIAARQPDRFSARDLIQVDRQLVRSRIEREELRLEIAQLELMVQESHGFQGEIGWKWEDLVSLEQIKTYLGAESQSILENNLFLQNQQNRVSLEEAIMEINKQESFSNIGYFQAEFREDSDRNFAQNLGFQIGFNIPIVNSDRPDLERRRLELIGETLELEEDRSKIDLNAKLLKLELASTTDQYEAVAEKEREYQSKKLGNFDPGDALDATIELKEFQFELGRMSSDLFAKVLASYIDLLAYDGKLSATPYQNYLSSDNATFSIRATND